MVPTSVRPISDISEYSLVALQYRRIRYIDLPISADTDTPAVQRYWSAVGLIRRKAVARPASVYIPSCSSLTAAMHKSQARLAAQHAARLSDWLSVRRRLPARLLMSAMSHAFTLPSHHTHACRLTVVQPDEQYAIVVTDSQLHTPIHWESSTGRNSMLHAAWIATER